MDKLQNAIKALEHAGEEASRIERALGRALLSKLEGKFVDPIETYKELGGADEVVVAVFESGMSEALSKIEVGPGQDAFAGIADRVGDVTVNKRLTNPGNAALSDALTDVEGTHFNILNRMAPKLVQESRDKSRR